MAFALLSAEAKAQTCPNQASACNTVYVENCTNFDIGFQIVYCTGIGTPPVISNMQTVDAQKCDPPTPFSVSGQIVEIELDGSAPPVNAEFNPDTCTLHISM